MSVDSRLISLRKEHEQLEQEIRDAYLTHQPTAKLKKEKLRIKDEMENLLACEKTESLEIRKAA